MRGIICGTGPSLTPQAIELINSSPHLKCGCNLTFQDIALDVFYACNEEFWDYYGPDLKHRTFKKYTRVPYVAEQYGAQHIEGVWKPGLSTDSRYIHLGHGSGYELLGPSYHCGVREFVLIGYDLKFPKGYDGNQQKAGGRRHYFGEYPKQLQHWTRTNIGPDGELNGLLDLYRALKKQMDSGEIDIRIINCSPNSALDFFETGDLRDWI